jgi:polygalacturonase
MRPINAPLGFHRVTRFVDGETGGRVSTGCNRCSHTFLALALLFFSAAAVAQNAPLLYDVRTFGAKGDGTALDTDAINRAIDTAANAGGGTVYLPAGRYLSFSIHLKSNITLQFAPGAVLVAADPARHQGHYDLPEPTEDDLHQDFGHSHWHNSLIWGEGLDNVSIVGPGLIDGRALMQYGPPAKWSSSGKAPLKAKYPESMKNMSAADFAIHNPTEEQMQGLANKAIALKRSRNVLMRDFSIFRGGHFAILVTGVDNLTLDNLKIDTNRDGIDLDVVRNTRLSNIIVNSPNDDAIVLKSSHALGKALPTENVTITNCQVSGYDIGTVLDGTYQRTLKAANDNDGVTGRIKLGTESNGGFRNITISNCVFNRSRGLALETVDGGVMEDITITNITMREVTTSPIFIRLGNRGRGPKGTGISAARRIHISNLIAYDVEHRFAAIIAGLPNYPIEDVTLSNIRIVYRGGGTAADAAREIPENESSYPEPSMFGITPAHGLFIRHARRVLLRDIDIRTLTPDARPAIVLKDAADVQQENVKTGLPAR